MRTSFCYQPSTVLGGDVLGHQWIDGERLALYVFDVCGHGAAAAMHSASVVNVLRNRTLGVDLALPAAVLGRLDASFPMEQHAGMYSTAWYGVYDVRTRTLEYASAGHPPALLGAPDADARRLQTRNPPIGVIGGHAFDQARVAVAPGERLLVSSDGAFEIVEPGGHAWSFDDFERLVRAHADCGSAAAERLRDAVLAASGRSSFEDDFTLLLATFP